MWVRNYYFVVVFSIHPLQRLETKQSKTKHCRSHRTDIKSFLSYISLSTSTRSCTASPTQNIGFEFCIVLSCNRLTPLEHFRLHLISVVSSKCRRHRCRTTCRNGFCLFVRSKSPTLPQKHAACTLHPVASRESRREIKANERSN